MVWLFCINNLTELRFAVENQLQNIGQALKQCRRKKNLTQQQLSAITGIARNVISDIEHGKFQGAISTLLKYMRWANLSLTYSANANEFPQLEDLEALFSED